MTNILLSYLTTARGDSKRFEMLSLLSSILSWSDLEREQAGLQKSSVRAGSMLRRPSGIVARPIAEDEEEPAANEVRRHMMFHIYGAPEQSSSPPLLRPRFALCQSFSQLFVEFLMKEATSGAGGPPSTASTPASPAASTSFLSPGRPSYPSLSASGQSTPTGSPRAQNRTLSLAPFSASSSGSGSAQPSPPLSEAESSRPRLGSMASFGLRALGVGGSRTQAQAPADGGS